MKLPEWQTKPELIQWALDTFATAPGRAFLQMLEDSHIRHAQVPHVGNEVVDSRELGKIYGYDLAINNIHASMQPGQPKVALQETFGAEETLAKEQSIRSRGKK